MEQRLQKIIAAAGIASRRKAEELILGGRVTVNGHTVTVLGTKADLDSDRIRVNGRLVRDLPAALYLLLNKPRKVICTLSDPQGRTKVTDLIGIKQKLYPVGRLDYNTEGLILLTNDGEFAKVVGSAGANFPKVYHVKIRSALDDSTLECMRAGSRLRDGTRLAGCKIERMRAGNNSWLSITLTQGRNRQIRKMFEEAGHPVMKLRRVQIGFLTDRGLPVGHFRHLDEREVKQVMQLARLERGSKAAHSNFPGRT